MSIYNWINNEFIDPFFNIIKSNTSFNQPPIILHQMGKVASKSIHYSLDKSNVDYEIFRSHLLTEKTFKEWGNFIINKKRDKKYIKNVKNQIKDGKQLRSRIELTKKKKIKCNVITLIRDPMGYFISGVFQNIYVIYPNVHKDYEENSEKTIQKIKNMIINQNDDIIKYLYERPLTFFDQEIKKVWDVDVYSYKFPKNKGYKIYENNHTQILLLKFEKLKDCINLAINDFLNINKFKLHKRHDSKKKKYGDIYSDFLNSIFWDKTFIDEYYSSNYITHFYSDNELDAFREKWVDII